MSYEPELPGSGSKLACQWYLELPVNRVCSAQELELNSHSSQSQKELHRPPERPDHRYPTGHAFMQAGDQPTNEPTNRPKHRHKHSHIHVS